MKKLALVAIALGSLAAAACTPPTTINITANGGQGGAGGSDNGGNGGEETTTSDPGTTSQVKIDGHYVYVNEVYPSVIETCGGCHNPDGQVGAPAFLDYDVELSYSLTKNYPNALKVPAESILITKKPHTGPALSDNQKEIVGNWLVMELDELSGGGTGGSGGSTGSTTTQEASTLETMLEEFAACMDKDIWDASGMDKLSQQQTNGDGPCYSCHSTGTGALWLSLDPEETFEKSKIFPYIMRLVSPVYTGSNPTDLAASNRILNKGKEPCQNPPICHPQFDLTPANKLAFETFVSTTLTKWQSGACAKP